MPADFSPEASSRAEGASCSRPNFRAPHGGDARAGDDTVRHRFSCPCAASAPLDTGDLETNCRTSTYLHVLPKLREPGPMQGSCFSFAAFIWLTSRAAKCNDRAVPEIAKYRLQIDHSIGRSSTMPVACKYCMLATVSGSVERARTAFAWARKEFVTRARLCAKCKHGRSMREFRQLISTDRAKAIVKGSRRARARSNSNLATIAS